MLTPVAEYKNKVQSLLAKNLIFSFLFVFVLLYHINCIVNQLSSVLNKCLESAFTDRDLIMIRMYLTILL